jgi:hypothetical protein
MKKRILTKMAPLAGGLMLFAGCVTYSPPPDYSQPPPSQVEVVPPQPDVTFIWTPGYWDWRGRWVWVRGYWGPRLHPGAVWVRGGWVYHGHHRVWARAHWQ